MLFAPTVHKLSRISYNLSLFTPFQVFPTPTWLLHPILLSVWLTARAFIAQVAFLLASSPCSPDPLFHQFLSFRLLVHGSIFALLCLQGPLPFSSTRVSRDEDLCHSSISVPSKDSSRPSGTKCWMNEQINRKDWRRNLLGYFPNNPCIILSVLTLRIKTILATT